MNAVNSISRIVSVFLVLLIAAITPIASQAQSSDGLIAYYPFDGDATDHSGNGNDGYENGGIQYKPGVNGAAVSFDGIDDYIRVPSDDSLNPEDQLSISFWVKVNEFTNVWSPIVHKGGPYLDAYANREYTVWLKDTSSMLLHSAGDDDLLFYQFACCTKVSDWTHFVSVIDRQDQRMRIYINGVLEVDVADPYLTFNINDNDLLFGGTEEVDTSISPYYGQIDELHIYNHALTEDEVKGLYDAHAEPKAIITESTFDTGLDGWTGSSRELSWRSSGGNPNGYAYWRDSNPSLRLSAPTKFFGDWNSLDGNGSIRFDQAIISTGNFNGRGSRIVNISGPGGSATWYGPTAPEACPSADPACSWSTFTVPLVETAWTIHSGTWAGLLAEVTGFAIASELYANVCCGTEQTGLDNVQIISSIPDLFGEDLQLPATHAFSLEQYAQQDEVIHLINTGTVSRTATLAIISPYPEVAVALQSKDPVTIEPGATETLSIKIDATSADVGVYEGILLEVAVDDGSTLYSNITVNVTEPGAPERPDLAISSEDIGFTSANPDDPVTLTATVRNRGQSSVSSIQVEFYEFDTFLGSTVIDAIPVEGTGSASITIPALSDGDHLIRVVIDPADTIEELDETNNEASQIIQPGGTPGPTEGHILVTGSLPSTVYTDALFSLTGQAVYDITVDGVRYTNYVVKGASVDVTIKAVDGTEWVYGGIHTNVDGNFTKSLLAPSVPGIYRLFMTVTDKTFVGTRELVFTVAERPDVPPPPPPAPNTTGTGEWTFAGGVWTWTWTSLPTSGPAPETDVRIFSENVFFSENNPAAGEEITVFAEILYWATSTALVAWDVPVNFYATYPGTPKELIGQTVIPSLSVGAPENGSRYVYATWKNPGEGIYLIEVEIDPSFVEENMLNNAATRAIIVGQLASNQGAISGEITNAWGGVEGVIINVYDASGLFLGSTVTDETGFYLFDSIPAGEAEVRIETPAGYVADADTKTVDVDANSVTQDVDFSLTEQAENAPPIADPGGPYSATVGEAVSFDGAGSSDPDGTIEFYEWDFGDGTSGTGVSPSHAYAAAGAYTVRLTVVDDEGARSAPATQTVTVEDTTPPIVTVPDDIIAEATGPSGAVVSFPATATDAVDGDLTPTCTPDSGSTFALGTTAVTCTATDAAGNSASASFNVTVVDTTPPVVTPPADVTVEATGPQTAVAIGTATATDAVGVVSISSDAPATYPVGSTTVTWSATDAVGNVGTATQTVTVEDTTPPIMTVPDDIIAEATGPSGAVVSFPATATDAVDGDLTPTCTPDSGSTFALGMTPVTCTATDAAGNSASASFGVTVIDTVPPSVTVPADITVAATGPAGSVVTYNTSATDVVDGALTPNCAPASGSTFALGTTPITCAATDVAGNSASASFKVTVLGAILCDADLNGVVDINDMRAIAADKNTPAVPNDVRDVDGDGSITLNDARQCVLQCTNSRCAPSD